APRDPRYESGLFYLGLAAFRIAEYQQMVDALEELSRRRPTPSVLNNLAVGYLAKGDASRALPLLQRLVATRPRESLFRFNFGYALWRNGQHDEAISQLRALLEQAPQDGEVLFLLANSLRETGREAEAAGFDNEAKRYLPDYARRTVDPANTPIYGRISHDFDPSDAEVETSPGREGGPSAQVRQRLDAVRRTLAANDIAASDELAALRELDAIGQLDAGNAEVAFLLGLIRLRRGETEAALNQFRTAVTRDPGLFEAHLRLGQIYLERNDRARAAAHVNQALAIEPASREAAGLKQRIESGR
ncbi:MAG: tetratricopeptide repeat protein, partial [Acidobacteria bacterium]|nr:tetratricopeptide repeat protein [Acidobacteriota bacterium]